MKPRLRRYQRLPFAAVVQSVAAHDGASFVLMFPRQAGKNETSAMIEAALLGRYAAQPLTGIKSAPTATPQARISADRLRDTLARMKLPHWRDAPYIGVGRARWAFLSAEKNSNVVGHTAGILLECDEAQDTDPDKWDKEFKPMGATTNVTTVYYGTPWTEDDLLGRAMATAREEQRRTGRRRLFTVQWEDVAAELPAYGRYVEGERDRLGANHPLFVTQYGLQLLPGAGRLLTRAQLAAIFSGRHPRKGLPDDGAVYVAGLDVAGADTAAIRPGRDSTVLTIGRLTFTDPALPPVCDVVEAYEATGTEHQQLFEMIVGLLRETWRVALVALDETTLGEGIGMLLRRALGEKRVRGIRYTQASKSSLGFGLQSAATSGRLHMWANDDSPEWRRARFELTACRAEYLPNRMVRWDVPETEGHDDYVNSLALLADAAENARPAPVAKMRRAR